MRGRIRTDLIELPIRVLVFASVNEPGLEIVQGLAKSNKVSLFGGSSVDGAYDPSRLLLKRHLRCPALGEAGFRREFELLLSENEIDLVFPTVDALVAELSQWELPKTRVIASPAPVAELVLSKSDTYERLRGVVPVPDVYTDARATLPAFAKPHAGSGSRGTRILTTQSEVSLAMEQGMLIHEYLPGEEFTVDCFSDAQARLCFSKERLRARIGRGISLGTAAVDRPDLKRFTEAIAGELPMAGPWFAQFKEDARGKPKLLELSSRVAGSSALTRLSGVNIPLLSVFAFAGYEVEIPRAVKGVRVNRLLRTVGEMNDFDWVIWDLEDTIVRKDGRTDPDAVARLYDLSNQGVRQLLLTRHTDPIAVLRSNHIPDLFVGVESTGDKVSALTALLAGHGIVPDRCVLINDSMTENLEIQKRYPELTILLPDALDALAREQVG
jgi:carbamoyl-phosphate synthase large subunit